MNDSDSVVFVIDDDASIREALSSLVRSVGLAVETPDCTDHRSWRHDERVRAMKAGAVEFLTKPFRDQDLLDAIRQAPARRRARPHRAELEEIQPRDATLSAREREVLALVGRVIDARS